MKKFFALFLALTLMAAVFAGCSDGTGTSPAPEASPAASPEASPAASPEASPAASPEASPAASPEASPAASPEASPAASPEASPAVSPEASPAVSNSASLHQAAGYTFNIPSGWEVGGTEDGVALTVSNTGIPNVFISLSKNNAAGDTVTLFGIRTDDNTVEAGEDGRNLIKNSYKQFADVIVEKCELKTVAGGNAVQYALNAVDAEKKITVEGVFIDSNKDKGGDLLSVAVKSEGEMPPDVQKAFNSIIDSIKFS